MIRRVTRRRRRPEPRNGAALERRAELWPFVLAAGLTAAAATMVEPKLDGVDRASVVERQLAERVQAGHR